ncbi:MAG TPA: M14 family metallopeptidase, partial [Prolixibacteraceae bacterium]|nr:M14 family metallopeptidase [Prolixibacteraceae bacterium]
MIKKAQSYLLTLLMVSSCFNLQAQNSVKTDKYHTNNEVQKALNDLHQKSPERTILHKIAESPGGEPIYILEIGKELKNVPAIFVGANFEGKTPISTEGALYMARMLLDSASYTSHVKWYILALPNPDATAGFFSGPRWERSVNSSAVNNDKDDQLDEDGPDDLNKDGFITSMRVEDPEGTYVISGKDPRIMVKADPGKGERGRYKLYPEGLDNDGDGEINEDGPGGINNGINFPHLFKTNAKETGLWPGEAPEVYGTMNFIFGHPEIAMVFTLGTSDFCSEPPRGGRKGGANLESLRVPARYATMIGADPEKRYTMTEVVEMFKAFLPSGGGREINAETVAGILGLGAVVNPLEDDLKFYKDFSDQYKVFLKAKGAVAERMAADPDKDGSFELWAYYQLGVPSFSMNLFTPPKFTEQKPGEEAAKENSARPVDGFGKEKNLLSYIDKKLNGSGFVQWQPFSHPTLGKLEIGSLAPFVASTPPPAQIDSLCRMQLPWLLTLSKKLPELHLMKEVITDLGAGVYRPELYVENKGVLPYPIAMGNRNKQPAPAVIVLEGENLEILEGYQRTPLGEIGGNQVK